MITIFANQIRIIQKGIKIEMKSINIDAWLLNLYCPSVGLAQF
jgi:hypothetical protein